MRYVIHQLLLEQGVAAGKLPLFTWWLRWQWLPYQKDSTHLPDYPSMIHDLTDVQIEQLVRRNLIPPPGPILSDLRPLERSAAAVELTTFSGVRITDDPIFEQQIYRLPTGEELRLRPGELQSLVRHGYPSTPERLMYILDHTIAPRVVERNYRVDMRLHEISAVVHTNHLEPAELLGRLRKLVFPPSMGDTALVRLLDAEHGLLELITDLAGAPELDWRISEWRQAQGNLVFWQLPDMQTDIADVAGVLVPSVAGDRWLMECIQAVRDVVAEAIAALSAEANGEFVDGWFEARTLRAAVERLQRAVSRVSGP